MENKQIATRERLGSSPAELGGAHENLVVSEFEEVGATRMGYFRGNEFEPSLG